GQSVENYLRLDHVTAFSHLADGIDLREGSARMEIRAIQPNILRIRVSQSSDLGEDASWAVRREVQQSHQPVTAADSDSTLGFRTENLHVSVDRRTFAVTIYDRDGKVLQRDARPTEFYGKSFRVFKEMPLDEHYFGLGDKPGPLDRRDQAFTL